MGWSGYRPIWSSIARTPRDGECKVGRMLVDFFKHDTTTGWFRSETTIEHIFYLPVIFFFLPDNYR
jgi:hypothetical protein